jgi:hypothetical protein
MGTSILKIVGAIALATILAACSVWIEPSRQLIEHAIGLELNQTQQTLNQQLRIGSQPANIQIQRVTITDTDPLLIEALQSFHVQGTYDYTVKLPSRQVTQRQNPFDLYLQRQKEGKTWRLARLQQDANGESVWVTQRLPF